MGIELHPKFLSLTEPRRYQPLRESIVAKCCQIGVSAWRVERMLIPPQTSVFKVKFDHVRVQRVHAEVAIYI
jgi:hypothetical protein